MSVSNENNPQVAVISIGTQGTDNTQLGVMHFPKKSIIKSIKLMDNLGVAASDSNYVEVSVKNQSGDAVIAELDSRAAHENGLAAKVAKALNLADSAGVEVAAGTNLYFDYQETGTVTLTAAQLFIEYYPL